MSDWLRVSKRSPCPICLKPDWCMVTRDGAAAICPRVADGAKRLLGEAGYLHVLREDMPRPRPRAMIRRQYEQTEPLVDFGALSMAYCDGAGDKQLADHARQLGVTDLSLHRMGAGIVQPQTWSFPMSTPDGKIVGIRIRHEDGKKWAVRGSKAALFIPTGMRGEDTLIVCEGPTDTAAMLDLGYDVIGRPSCRGCHDYVATMGKGRNVVIVADEDGPGRDGADALAKAIRWKCKTVKIIEPNGRKDAREWCKRTTTNRAVVDLVIHETAEV